MLGTLFSSRGPIVRMTDLYPRSALGKILWYGVWAPINLIAAFLPLLSLNLLQFPSLLIRPFSKDLYRRYNRFIAYMVWGWWAWGIQRLIGLQVIITGDSVPNQENAIVIANHQGMADIIIMLILAAEKRCLGWVTWMAKAILRLVPGLGWGMAFLDTIFLKRNWADDHQHIKATFAHVTQDRVPIWLTMFPEGTRLRPKKLGMAQQFAQQQGLSIPRHVLIPRPKGFLASIEGLRQHAQAVYSLTIAYVGSAPSLLKLIRGEIPRAYMHVRRIPMNELPTDDAALTAWLRDDFQRRDNMLAAFYEGGCQSL